MVFEHNLILRAGFILVCKVWKLTTDKTQRALWTKVTTFCSMCFRVCFSFCIFSLTCCNPFECSRIQCSPVWYSLIRSLPTHSNLSQSDLSGLVCIYQLIFFTSTVVDLCQQNNPCQNNGICQNNCPDVTCTCPPCWTGEFCQDRESKIPLFANIQANTSTR